MYVPLTALQRLLTPFELCSFLQCLEMGFCLSTEVNYLSNIFKWWYVLLIDKTVKYVDIKVKYWKGCSLYPHAQNVEEMSDGIFSENQASIRNTSTFDLTITVSWPSYIL
jgi:hypothetical protein